ncbi:MAG: ATP-dependent Clp protease ATP-binding subunit ClpA [Labilithrix sp.]|nr:ATP-dependent Clp protease ATP-binding subunit ClpA [Labilithrix sp.]
MATKSFRVYFVSHASGLKSGILMRAKNRLVDLPPPTAIGSSEEDVYRQLEVLVVGLEVSGDDTHERYLWEESFDTQEVSFDVHPQTSVEKRIVIGAKKIPLRMTYVHAKLASGGHRIMLPRFGWGFIVEELGVAKSVLGNALSTALLGENPRDIYEFRREGEEYVREWSPRTLTRGTKGDEDEEAKAHRPTLDSVAVDLVDKAARGKLPFVVGDSLELERAKSLVGRDPPPSILLVGGPGVGKSTWVRRLARQLLLRQREAGSAEKASLVPRIWSTSSDRILAGMTYLGMWQKRCLDLAAELSHEGDWLYVDRLVPILEPQSDGSSIADVLGPSILAGDIALIAECTEEELERCQRRFATLVSTFHTVRLDEPPSHRMPELLALYQARKGGPSIHPAGLKRLVVHLASFQKDQRFPGKGFRFLDWLAASAEAAPPAAGQSAPPPRRQLYPADVSRAYARFSGLPLEILSDEAITAPDALVAALRKGVIGQDDACRTAARVLARLKAGLVDPEKPAGTLLFVGPTGVGKTELAKQLARFLFHDEARMIRVDMSEYMLPGSAQRLLWAAEGTESLAQRVRAQPLSVVLFDEVEKAHPEVFDLLLGVLGEGRLTDSFGRLVDFRMTILVMTSNLGVTETRSVGFEEGGGDDFVRRVREHFRPELFNRIDHVIPFRRLSPADVHAIVSLELDKIRKRTGLVRKNLELRVEPAARDRLAELGWHPTRGARPLKRVLEERVVAPLAALLAADPTIRDRVVVVSVNPHGAIDVRASPTA